MCRCCTFNMSVRLTHARGEVSVICNLIARQKVVCAIGLGFSLIYYTACAYTLYVCMLDCTQYMYCMPDLRVCSSMISATT